MAVNFHHHVDALIRDFQRRGLEPEIVQVSGNPPRAMEIRVAKKISVHWDADTRSVWAEGPWPEIERLESYIRRRFNGRWRRRPKKLVGLLVAGLLAGILISVCSSAVRGQLPLAWPFGEKTSHGLPPATINPGAQPPETASFP